MGVTENNSIGIEGRESIHQLKKAMMKQIKQGIFDISYSVKSKE